MGKENENRYIPDYLVTPGEVLDEYLESFGMTQIELADRLGFSKKTVNEIVKGKAPILPDTALKLEKVFGRPAHFWNNLEQQFQEDRARLEEQERLKSYIAWLDKVPVKDMVRLRFINKHSDKSDQLNEVLRFFGIASPDQWRLIWEHYQVAYRQSQRYAPCAEAVSAWLRQGEILAQRMDCAEFDKNKFQNVLDDIRVLTREAPEVFHPRLIEMCSTVGVAVVFVPDLPKTGICGATRWLGNKPIIQLSLRYKSNDQLWFTFFHEAGHILKHGRKDIFLEGNGMNGEKEEEANIFARDKLIPPNLYRQFISSYSSSLAEVIEFADGIGIAPGIVVGRLQHDKRMPINVGNKLKVFYRWAQ